MDVVTYALLKKQIGSILPGYTYKGSAASVAALPDDAETGDLYTVGGDQYVWNGTAWVTIIAAIPDATINALFS